MAPIKLISLWKVIYIENHKKHTIRLVGDNFYKIYDFLNEFPGIDIKTIIHIGHVVAVN